jgi:UDPglucose 6-dehydrogenase
MNRISRAVINKMFNTVSGKKIAILGFAFKKNTNDSRESPAIKICQNLLNENAMISIYDPKVERKKIIAEVCHDNLEKVSNIDCPDCVYSALSDADCAIFVTDWDEFKNLDWDRISRTMRKPAWIFDTRRQINVDDVSKVGLRYWTVGRS